jgi:hypothetical protein
MTDYKHLLDNGWQIRIYRNAQGTYTARAIKPRPGRTGPPAPRKGCIETEDFEPTQALCRLAEKIESLGILMQEKNAWKAVAQ